MVLHMAVVEEVPRPWIPNDTFAVRLAAIRVALGEISGTGAWNVKKAATFCGVDAGSWRNWEASKHPQDYIAVCNKIARKVGCDLDWLVRGGPLPTPIVRWCSDAPSLTSVNACLGQLDFHFELPVTLASVAS